MKSLAIPNLLILGILFIAAFLFVFLFSSTTSPLYEHYPFWFHGDSGIFQEMGVCLVQGGTPYVDLFDHKGPILWFSQAFGILISPKWGIMALQSVFLFVVLIVWFKSVLLLTGRQLLSIIISISGLFFLMAFYQRGNLCEEWSLLFISLPIYYYLKRWKKEPNSKCPIFNHTDAIVMGVCVGIIAMIRLNNTAPLVGFTIWHFIRCIQQKDYKRMWTDIALICGGIAMIFVICSLFYLIKAGWSGVYEMIYGTFIFNIIYMNGTGDLPLITRLQHYFPSILFFAISLFTIHNKSLINVNNPILISYIVTLLAIGSFGYVHYMIIFIPLFLITISLIVNGGKIISYILLGTIVVHSAYLGYDAADHLLFRLKGIKASTELNDGFHRFVVSLPDDEKKSIYNAGLNNMGAGLFADELLFQCNRFLSNEHLRKSSYLREYEETHGIKSLCPIWVLTQSPRPEATDEYMQVHYTLADSILGGEFDPIWCWKKNENK
ncbi:MAG: hypothetical protein K5864_01255 [Bacteroidales bacterium]|nr:hypothetical protein [Bacteroidales bacterium]